MGKNKYGFSKNTTSNQVLKGNDLFGKHYIITGTTIGSIGYQTALSLFNFNAEVSILNRNEEKMKLTKEMIEKQASKDCKGIINCFLCDLSSQKSVGECVEKIKKFISDNDKKIDCIIANAGLMVNKKQITVDKFERTLAVCHFGHFRLIISLLEYVVESGRIVNVASSGGFGSLDFDDLFFEKKKYSKFGAYGNAKLANIIFTKELDKRLKKVGKNIDCFAVHPSGVDSNFVDNSGGVFSKIGKITMPLFSFLIKNIDQGSSTSIFSAVDERLEGKGGLFLKDCCESEKYNKKGTKDQNVWKKLFDLSEELCGVKFPFPLKKEETVENSISNEAK